MSTKFGIPLYPVDDAILLTEDGELQPYIDESFFRPVFFHTYRNSRWIGDHKLPNDTKVYALDNSHQGIRTIADCKKILEDETNTQV